jgi:hypothetical protein
VGLDDDGLTRRGRHFGADPADVQAINEWAKRSTLGPE